MLAIGHRSLRMLGLFAAIIACGFAFAGAASAALIGYWPMNEGTGLTTANVGTQGNGGPLTNGTLMSGAGITWVNDGTRGMVLSFNGTSYVDAGSVVIGNSTDFTWSIWVNSNNNGDKVLMGSRKDDSAGQWNKLTSNKYEGNTLESGTQNFSVTDGVWTHLAVTRSGTNIAVYKNGVVVGTSNGATGNNLPSAKMFFGGDSDYGEYHNGLLDDAAIWDIALTQAQITQLATGTSPTAIGVPEPSTFALLGLGLLAVGYRARQRLAISR